MENSSDRPEVAASFSPIEGGYVYQAPSAWPWRQVNFVVDASLRERLIAAADEPTWALALWLAIPWLVVSLVGAWWLALYFGESPGHEIAAVAGGLAAAVVGLGVGLAALGQHRWQRVAPLLRGVRRTEERIPRSSFTSSLRAAGADPPRAMFAQLLGGALLLAVGSLNLGMSIQKLGDHGGSAWAMLISGAVLSVSGFLLVFVAGRNLVSTKR